MEFGTGKLQTVSTSPGELAAQLSSEFRFQCPDSTFRRNYCEKLPPGSIVPLTGEFERRNIHQQDIATINQFVIN